MQAVIDEGANGREEALPQWLALLGLAAVAVLLLTFRLDHPELWGDELFTASYIRNDYGYLLSLDRADERHPPGHYVLLKAWTSAFGDDRAGLRSLSVLSALLCLPLLHALVRERLDARTALLATLLLALFPGFLHYGREARMYAPLFACLLAASFFSCACRRASPTRACPSVSH